MKLKFILTSLILIVSINLVNSQNKKLKKIKKSYEIYKSNDTYSVITHKKNNLKGIINNNGDFIIEPTHEFISSISTCNSVITGEYKHGPSDGGGSHASGLRNVNVIFLETKKETLINFDIKFTLSSDNFNYNHIYKTSTNGKMGLMNNCGEILLEPKYDYINGFNSKGQVIVFYDNKYEVINDKGQILTDTPFIHKFDYNSFYTVPRSHFANKWKVFDNKIIASADGVNFGVYDLTKKKIAVPYKYTGIEVFKEGNEISAYKIFKDGKESLIGYKTNQVLLPFIFDKITSTKPFNYPDIPAFYAEGEYVGGQIYYKINGQSKSYENFYDLKSKKLLFDFNTKSFRSYPLNDDVWLLEGFNSENLSVIFLYDLTNKKYIISPENSTYSKITNIGKNHVSVTKLDGSLAIMDLKGVFKTDFLAEIHYGRAFTFNSKTDNKIHWHIIVTKILVKSPSGYGGHVYNILNIYDDNKTLIHKIQGSNFTEDKLKVKDNLLIIKEKNPETGSKSFTAIDGFGKMIGERYMYKP